MFFECKCGREFYSDDHDLDCLACGRPMSEVPAALLPPRPLTAKEVKQMFAATDKVREDAEWRRVQSQL